MVAKNNFSTLKVLRKGAWQEDWSSTLVPGDVILVPSGGCFVPADCVLLTGEAIVNEGMLTGECIPVTKNALAASRDPYNSGGVFYRKASYFGRQCEIPCNMVHVGNSSNSIFPKICFLRFFFLNSVVRLQVFNAKILVFL